MTDDAPHDAPHEAPARHARSADGIRDIVLEFLRAGPAHNQLLSPLTPYMALCGAEGPVSIHLPFEHAQWLTRLNRLRYEIDGVVVPPAQRESELRELGDAMGRLLATIPALVSALHAARAESHRLVNIRLRISAFELALLPFEATTSPLDTSGAGTPLLLHSLTGMTREIRRGEPLPLDWNREPKILFAFASPDDLAAVPAQDHVDALRRAIDPWVGIKDTPAERLVDVRRMLTVLPRATLAKISAACALHDYTHVHILAHGAPMSGGENRRFGLCLAAGEEDDGGGHVVVDGQSLALALKSEGSDGRTKPPPTVVTLATCDSGNVGSVLTPGGSIAHELHAEDIPWVIASQFPLWMRAASLCTEVLYRGLLGGKDPRGVLHDVRQRLRIALPTTHDWASIVAYAAMAADLPAQVDAFHTRQTKAALDVKFARMDALVARSAAGQDGAPPTAASIEVAPELALLCTTVRADLSAWCDEPIALQQPKERAARLAMRAASEKRIAIVYGLLNARDGGGDVAATAGTTGAEVAFGLAFESLARSLEAYGLSRRFYDAALQAEPANHWAITQFLSIIVTPALAPGDAELAAAARGHGRWWQTARQLAEWDAAASLGRARAWAHGTLAELEMLGVVYAVDERSSEARLQAVIAQCRLLCEVPHAGAFPVAATQRQFRRYLDHWARPQWAALAKAAVAVLQRGAG